MESQEKSYRNHRPNVVIIHCDQLRSDCLGCYGNPDVQTKNLDKLAEESTKYTNHYTVYPICTPSRYSFWSSLYVHQHGAWDNQATLPPGYATFPGILRENGYRTAAVGKMHMNPTYQDIGFSRMELAEQNGIGRFEDDYHRFLMEKGKIDRFDLHHQSGIFQDKPTTHLRDMCQCGEPELEKELYSTEWITDRAISEIESWDSENPQLLMVGYINPHHPFDPPAPYSTMYDPRKLTLLPGYIDNPFPQDIITNGTDMKYEKLSEDDIRKIMAAYYGMITQIDDCVGRIFEKLKEKNLYDNTMIIFTSDHGDYMGYHHMMLKCNHLYEPLARIPLLIKYPDGEFAGQTDDAFSENIDVSVTVLEKCGLKKADSMQGISLCGEEKRSFVFSEGQYGSETSPCLGYMIRTNRFKLLVRGSLEEAMFFDLSKDPWELCNQAHNPEYREELEKVKRELTDFILFRLSGKVYRDRKVPQLKSQEKLDEQAKEIKKFAGKFFE